jgi:hypothetical protein
MRERLRLVALTLRFAKTDLKIGHYRCTSWWLWLSAIWMAFVLLNLNPALSERAATGDLRLRLLR